MTIQMAETKREMSPYEKASEDLSLQLERLRDLISNLEHRLNPALRPVGDKAEGSASCIKAAAAPMVDSLEYSAIRVDRMAENVSDLLQRLCM